MSQKRGRACIPCAKLKIKCELGSTHGAAPPCDRCVRLSKECELVPLRRRKDRVAELESQVATLTRMLRAQQLRNTGLNSSETPSASNDATSDGAGASIASDSGSQRDSSSGEVAEESTSYPSQGYNSRLINKIDDLISQDIQEKLRHQYFEVFLPTFPLVSPAAADTSLTSLRDNGPLLLLAIIYATGPSILETEPMETLSQLLLREIKVQIASLWSRTTKNVGLMTPPELMQLSLRLTKDIGQNDPFTWGLPNTSQSESEIESSIAWRACLATHVMCVCTAVLTRHTNFDPWDDRKERGLFVLDYSEGPTGFDRWFAQYVRAEHLCEQILTKLGTNSGITCENAFEPSYQQMIQSCLDDIINWKMQIPKSHQVPTILLWEHVANVYAHEHVLYTATNRGSFSGPYSPDRLSASDFPCPVVTQSHTASLIKLRDAIHNIIDIFNTLDAQTIAILPGLFFGSRAVYALYLLAKLHISVSANTSTYGQGLDLQSLKFTEYAGKLVDVKERLASFGDTTSAAYRVMGGITRTAEWISNFDNLQSNSVSPLDPELSSADYSVSGLSYANGIGQFDAQAQEMLLNDELWKSVSTSYPDPNFDTLDIIAQMQNFNGQNMP